MMGQDWALCTLSLQSEQACSRVHWLKVQLPFFPFQPKQYWRPLRSVRGMSGVAGFGSSNSLPLTVVVATQALGLWDNPPQKKHRREATFELELCERKESPRNLEV